MPIQFDTYPPVYFLMAWAVMFGLGGYLFRFTGDRFKPWPFLAGSSLLLILLRLPVLVYNRELNADESQMLTQALTLAIDPVYWRSVDGTTGGPLSSYFLIPIGLFRGAFDYITAHVAAFVLVLVTLFFLYKSLKNWFGAYPAALGILPAVLFYGFTKSPDFVHYTSEHFPIALLAVCTWLISFKNPAPLQLSALGFLLAAVPFGKIQAVPLAGILGLYALFRFIGKRDWNALKLFLGGIAAFCLTVVVLLFTLDLWDSFISYYILGNFRYSGNNSIWTNLLYLVPQYRHATDLLLLLAPPLFFLAARLVKGYRPVKPAPLLWLALFLMAGALLAIARTGSGYTHYLLFLTLPLSLLTTVLLPATSPSFRPAAYLALLTLVTGCIFLWNYRKLGVLNPFPSGPSENRSLPFSVTATEASRHLRNKDYLVVWGWNCQYYVECQAPQGVAENHSIRSVFEHPMRERYRERYLADIRRNKPAVFIDATGKNSLWLQDTLRQSYRSFPELARYIDRHYTFVGAPEGNRLFLRNDRLAVP